MSEAGQAQGRSARGDRGASRRAVILASGPGKRGDKRALYHCNYCRKDISNRVRIKSAVSPDFDLCLECFSVGAEIRPHKSDHAYRVVDNLSFPIYEPTWGADEELLLLEAVDMFGHGNWVAISEHVGTKTPEDCKHHFFSIFIEHDDFPLPKPSAAMLSYDEEVPKDHMGRQPVVTTPKPPTKTAAVAGDLTMGPAIKGDTMTDAGGRSVSSALPPLNVSFSTPKSGMTDPAARDNSIQAEPPHSSEQERHTAAKEKAKLHEGQFASGLKATLSHQQALKGPVHESNAMNLTPHSSGLATPSDKPGDGKSEQTGYNKFRHEFEPEFDNDAETIIAEIEFSEQDSEEDFKRKLRMMQVYNMRQDVREARRDHILKQNLLDVVGMDAEEAGLWPLEKLISSRLRPFSRFQSTDKIHEVRQGLAVEHCLRTRIAELQECRAAGIQKLGDVEGYGQQKKQRVDVATAAATAAAAVAVAAIPGLRLPVNLLQQQQSQLLQQQQLQQANFSTTSRPMRAAALANPLTSVAGSALVQAESPSSPASSTGFAPLLSATGAPAALDGSAALSFLLNWRIQQGKEFDIAGMPGVEHLKPEEHKLCSCLRLMPAHYLAVKEQMIRKEGSGQDKFTRSRACEHLSNLDSMKVTQIYDLLLRDGAVGQAKEKQ